MASSFALLTSCASYTDSATVAGAAAGAVIGKSTGDHGDRRAAKGAVIGAVAGRLFGHESKSYRKNRPSSGRCSQGQHAHGNKCFSGPAH